MYSLYIRESVPSFRSARRSDTIDFGKEGTDVKYLWGTLIVFALLFLIAGMIYFSTL